MGPISPLISDSTTRATVIALTNGLADATQAASSSECVASEGRRITVKSPSIARSKSVGEILKRNRHSPGNYGAARRLNKLRRYFLRRSVVLRSLASAGSLRVVATRLSVPDLRSARRRSAPDRRSVVRRSIVPGIICLHRCPRHEQTGPEVPRRPRRSVALMVLCYKQPPTA